MEKERLPICIDLTGEDSEPVINLTPDVDSLIETLKQLNLCSEEELKKRFADERQKYSLLLVTMGEFLSKTCGNMNKLYEVALMPDLSAQYNPEHYDIVHLSQEYGPDITIIDRRTKACIGVEVKNSIVRKKHNYKTNWCFELSAHDIRAFHKEGTSPEEQVVLKQKLFDATYNKMQGGGYAIFVARCDEKLLAQYSVDGVFMAYYCVTHALMRQKGNINLGSVICSKCKQYHRIQKLQEYANTLTNRIRLLHLTPDKKFDLHYDYFTAGERKAIFDKSVDSQCKGD